MTYVYPVVWRSEVLGQIIWLPKTHGFSQQGAGLYCAALGRSDFPVPLLVVGNLLSIYCGLQVFQSNSPQAVWKMATTSSWSTYTQPRVALEMGGLKPAACSALGISGNLIPSSLGLKCEKPHALAFHPVLYESSARSRFTIPQGTQSVHVGVSSLWSKAVTPAVWSWCMEQGERFSFKNSLF